jgi:hypothetical protein
MLTVSQMMRPIITNLAISNYYETFSFNFEISSRSFAATIKFRPFAVASICLHFSLIRFSISFFGKYCKSYSAAICFALLK